MMMLVRIRRRSRRVIRAALGVLALAGLVVVAFYFGAHGLDL
jgi:hypothetical protein